MSEDLNHLMFTDEVIHFKNDKDRFLYSVLESIKLRMEMMQRIITNTANDLANGATDTNRLLQSTAADFGHFAQLLSIYYSGNMIGLTVDCEFATREEYKAGNPILSVHLSTRHKPDTSSAPMSVEPGDACGQ